MPLILTFAHQKGGVGKSTLAINLYGWFSGAGYDCALVDTDPQGSLTHLLAAFGTQDDRKSVPLIRRGEFGTYGELADKLEPFDVAVIDTPPYLSRELMDVLAISHAAIVPCKASPLDGLAVQHTMDYINEIRRTQNSALTAAVVMTMVISGTEFTEQIRAHLMASGLTVLQAQIGNRVAYARSLLKGNSVKAEDGGKAWAEIEALGAEIVDLLNRSKL
jgi:chromosome partitioning protein